MGNEFGIAALRFDDRDYRRLFATRVATDQPMRNVFAFRTMAILGTVNRVLLHEDPIESAVLECLDEFVRDVRVVGQRHFRWRKATHAGEGFNTKDRSEVMLP